MTKKVDPIRRQITPELARAIGRQMKILRTRIGISRAEAAEKTGFHPSTIHTIEAGTRSPHLMTLLDILYAYDASASELTDFLLSIVMEHMRLRAVSAT
ncbi:predicted transcriptional regulators [Acetobacter aceti NRIC 0242]|uniref:HTH cro/C1-type domain-containing protein n=1 Tax=Acetobacter aceti NBRC 14818 TaxID=887700 RepID=A0AB33ICD3_ACEAC|nr:helix-turn-helix transcriptional regulator [Acetobacter aceti]TCS32449.1 helix-turn-helix protein [Acetobacter aceti NBRC 14818]BCK74973.1 hypothetical protein EMQ_0579 [Acetobacter aceti NBRC 14818]GAN56929.1 hypothetical protein Abac_012_003 [Acetobacter aceti NBRC 14818]GBO81390.1 predicted transcriptional regulators [Acetobacter aceti NRIC 0242]